MFSYLYGIGMKLLKIIGINVFVTLLFGELALRLAGFAGLSPYTVTSSPPHCLIADKEMGFALNPGVFSVSINEHLRYRATHEDLGWCKARSTGELTSLPSADSLILLTGCSFTYGMGVDDSLTYPYLLQARFPDYTIVNAAVPAHGTVQTLILLERLLARGIRPKHVIYHYISSHRYRNILARSFTQLLGHETRVGNGGRSGLARETRFPYGSIDETGTFRMGYSGIHPRNLFGPIRNYSALFNQLEILYDRISSRQTAAQNVTEAILLAIRSRCEEAGISFTTAIFEDGDDRHSMQGFCLKNGIPAVDLTLDYTDTSLLNLPYDEHPNAKAHGIWAERMRRYLFEHGLR